MEYKKLAKKNIKYYHLIEQIGKGATGKVWLAVDERKNELLAIKAIPNEYLKKEEGKTRIKSELENLHKLKHKNIIQIRGYEATKNNTYIALEYCNGGNLHEYQKFYQKTTKTTLNELYIQKIMKQITAGLEFMHLNKIIHRDIKLENILINFDKYPNLAIKGKLPPKVKYENISLSDSFTIKIADLGFSKNIEVSNITATVLGTPINMSPDIVNNYVSDETKSYNTSVDLWSLGAITYELLTGKQAFSGSQFQEVFKQIMEGKYTLPSSMVVSVEIISFINGLLQFYPEKRLNWEQIKTHPFLTKSTENFTYIELKSIAEGDKKNIELNSKNCDNLLWILFKGKLNLGLDKLNMKEIKGKDLKQSIMDNTVNNEEIKKAIELKKEAEKIKNEVNLIKQKNEEREKKLKDEELKRKEMEEKLKKEGELNQQKEQEIQKQMNEYQKQLQLLEKEKNENDQKLKNAEKLLKNAEKLKRDTENQIKTLEKNKEEEAKKRKEEEEKMKQKEKELIEEKNKFDKEIQKIKNEQNKKNENFEQEKNKMLKQIEEINKAKNDLEKEVNKNKNKEIENELQKKEYAIKAYKDKIKNMTDAKDLEIQKYEEERKQLELLQDKIKMQVENLKDSLSAEINNESKNQNEKKEEDQKDNIINEGKKEEEDKTDNLKINEQKVEIEQKDEDDSFDDFKKDWVIYDNEEAQSVNLSDKDEKNENIDDNDFLKDYEIIESFNDKDEKEAISKKIEI